MPYLKILIEDSLHFWTVNQLRKIIFKMNCIEITNNHVPVVISCMLAV